MSGLSDADDAALSTEIVSDGLAALATILGTQTAAKLLASFGTLAQISRASDWELIAQGLPTAKVRILRAAIELGRHSLADLPRSVRINNGGDVALYFRARIGSSPVEEFRALALNIRHHVMADLQIGRGSLSGVDVHPRDTFRALIRIGAAGVVFCHNHPSGDPSPSRLDLELTERLRGTGEICGINVLDHVIVTTGAHVSLADRGWR